MEPDDIQKQIAERVAALPENVQQAILSADLDKHLQLIGARHQLHIDQMGILGDETMLVMLGFMEPEEFSSQLEAHLNISKEKANLLASDISNEIFQPIRNSMKRPSSPPPLAPPPPSPTTTPPAPKSISMEPADLLLSQKTISMPPKTPLQPTDTTQGPPKPPQYTMDPYREPPE